MPGVLAHGVGHSGVNTTQHTQRRVGCIGDGKGDGSGRVFGHVPEPERPVVGAAVQSVVAIVQLGVVLLAVDGVLSFANAVGITPWDGVVHGMSRVLGYRLR